MKRKRVAIRPGSTLWEDWEKEFVLENYGIMRTVEIAAKLDRTRAAVYGFIRRHEEAR